VHEVGEIGGSEVHAPFVQGKTGPESGDESGDSEDPSGDSTAPDDRPPHAPATERAASGASARMQGRKTMGLINASDPSSRTHGVPVPTGCPCTLRLRRSGLFSLETSARLIADRREPPRGRAALSEEARVAVDHLPARSDVRTSRGPRCYALHMQWGLVLCAAIVGCAREQTQASTAPSIVAKPDESSRLDAGDAAAASYRTASPDAQAQTFATLEQAIRAAIPIVQVVPEPRDAALEPCSDKCGMRLPTSCKPY
jgi:hypothetical protein